jgi:hypothetical protein
VNIPQISIQHSAIPMVIGMAVVLFSTGQIGQIGQIE